MFGKWLFFGGVVFGSGGLRGYLFTDRDRERLRAWLESGAEDDGTRMLFVGVRRSLIGIAVNAGLLARVARRLETAARGLEEEKKDVKDLHIGAKA